METTSPQRIVSVAALLVGAVTLGMVLTGGLNITPAGNASHLAPVLATTAQATTAAPAAAATGYPDFAGLAEQVVPSVISVYTTDVVTGPEMRQFHRNMDPFEFFFGPRGAEPNQPRTREGAGSGFFISADGLALTNNHVVENADSIKVQLADNSEFKATVVGRDPATDIALIRVEGEGPFSFLSLGDSESLRVGEWVMAVGNPLNMDHTVTVGVVSAKGRALGLLESSFENFIQTDAAINRGNSGGPLVNVQGQVIGINSAINIQGQNLGFAIPINTARLILPQLQKTGKVVRGYLGVFIKNLDENEQKSFKLPSRNGALVQDLESDGPAAKAGIEAGDVIVTLDGEALEDTRQLIDRVSAQPPGSKIKLGVVRNGERKSITVELGERPSTDSDSEEAPSQDASPIGKLGMKLDEIDDRMRRRLDLPDNVSGLLVTEVEPLSPADEANLQPGLVIARVNGEDVKTVRDLTRLIGQLNQGDLVRLYVYNPRVGRSGFFILQMP